MDLPQSPQSRSHREEFWGRVDQSLSSIQESEDRTPESREYALELLCLFQAYYALLDSHSCDTTSLERSFRAFSPIIFDHGQFHSWSEVQLSVESAQTQERVDELHAELNTFSQQTDFSAPVRSSTLAGQTILDREFQLEDASRRHPEFAMYGALDFLCYGRELGTRNRLAALAERMATVRNVDS